MLKILEPGVEELYKVYSGLTLEYFIVEYIFLQFDYGKTVAFKDILDAIYMIQIYCITSINKNSYENNILHSFNINFIIINVK